MAEETVYKLKVDAKEAIDSLDKVDEKVETCREKLEKTGAAGKSAGDGIVGGIGKGADALDKLGGALSATNRATDSLGMSFAKNFSKASELGKSFSASVKSGIGGALDAAKNKVSTFAKNSVDNAKKVGNAFLHPIDTIKNKFSDAMQKAAKDTDKVGDEAKRSGRELDDMGKSGAGAGNKLKNGLGAALKVIAALAAAAFAIAGIAKFTDAAIKASQAADNIAYSFDKSFGDSAPDVQAWADSFSKAVHRSQTEVKNFLTSNKNFYEGLNISGQAAQDLSKITTSLAYDIGNKFGISDADALSGLQDGISGNADALSAYGIKLDDARLKQTALKMGIKGNLEEMDDATLAQIRLNAVLEQTGDIQQNASKSIGGLAGGIKSVQAVWSGFLEKAGAKMAPIFDKIFGIILDAWPQVEPVLLMFADMLAGGFEQAVPVMLDFSTTLLPQLLGLLIDFAPILTNLGGHLMPMFSQGLGGAAGAIGPLMPLVNSLVTYLSPLMDMFGYLASTLLPPIGKLLGALAPLFDLLPSPLKVVAFGVGLISDALAILIGFLVKVIEKVGEFANKLKDSAVGKFVGGIVDNYANAANTVKGFLTGNAKGTDDFEGGWTRLNEAGGELVHAKQNGGIAYLPKGSAILPASKTDAILSDSKNGTSPNPNWMPIVVSGNPNISGKNNPDDNGSNGDGGDNNDNNSSPNPVPTPNPSPVYPDIVSRKVIDLNITISSPDGSVPQEVMEKIKQEVLEAVQEKQDDDLRNLAIQNGYAG